MLHHWCIEFERGREEKLFDVPNESKVIERFKKDLDWAGIPYRLPDKRVFDFHAIRHTFKTWLEIAGVQHRDTVVLDSDRSHFNGIAKCHTFVLGQATRLFREMGGFVRFAPLPGGALEARVFLPVA